MNSEKITIRCSFCGRDSRTAFFLIPSRVRNDVYICEKCSEKAGAIAKTDANDRVRKHLTPITDPSMENFVKENNEFLVKLEEVLRKHPTFDSVDMNESAEHKTVRNMIPQDIYGILNETVIGQNKAKRALSVALFNHNKRISDETGIIKKSNILMAGPTGCGKTLLAQTLADIMNVPFVVADATTITEAGYVGESVDDILLKLYYRAEGDVSRVEQGIVYIDEIDKLAACGSTSERRDIKGEGVQQALLKMVEGTEVTINIPSGPNIVKKVKIDTRNILFICGGAFEGMLKEGKKNAFGFNSHDEETEAAVLSQEALRKFGMIPEIIGRFPTLVQLDELTEEELIKVMTEVKNSIIQEYVELLRRDGVELEFEYDALVEIARMAIEKGIGARGLRSIIGDVMEDIMFEIPSEKDVRRCIITRDTVLGKKPVLEYQKVENRI